MVQKQMQSIGDVAHRFHVHEQIVIEWAERNDLSKVGREFVLSARDVRDFERWLDAAGPAQDDKAPNGELDDEQEDEPVDDADEDEEDDEDDDEEDDEEDDTGDADDDDD